MRKLVILSVVASILTGVAYSAGATQQVQFRDLFFRGGKPSPQAASISGTTIEMVGFVAEAPSHDSPFLVLVGAPTDHCPYCNSVDDLDHLPYVLVYPDHPFDHHEFGSRTRIRVVGQLSASHDFEDYFGIHNDLRILSASVMRDLPAANPVQERLRAKRAAARKARAAEKAAARQAISPATE